MVSTSCRYYFDGLGSAAEALLAVLGHARETTDFYRFGALSAQEIAISGLLLEGELDAVKKILDKIPGAVRYDS